MIARIIFFATLIELAFTGQYATTFTDAGFYKGYFTDITKTFDGGYIACGPVQDSGGTSRNIYVVKLGSDYSKQWQVYVNSDSSRIPDVCKVAQYDMSSYIVASSRLGQMGTFDLTEVTKLDQTGGLMWGFVKSCSGFSNRFPVVNVKTDGSIILAGGYTSASKFLFSNYHRLQ